MEVEQLVWENSFDYIGISHVCGKYCSKSLKVSTELIGPPTNYLWYHVKSHNHPYRTHLHIFLRDIHCISTLIQTVPNLKRPHLQLNYQRWMECPFYIPSATSGDIHYMESKGRNTTQWGRFIYYNYYYFIYIYIYDVYNVYIPTTNWVSVISSLCTTVFYNMSLSSRTNNLTLIFCSSFCVSCTCRYLWFCDG